MIPKKRFVSVEDIPSSESLLECRPSMGAKIMVGVYVKVTVIRSNVDISKKKNLGKSN